MAKFKIGDVLTKKKDYPGFEEVRVKSIDDKWYHCTLMNGYTNIPLHIMESHYELL